MVSHYNTSILDCQYEPHYWKEMINKNENALEIVKFAEDCHAHIRTLAYVHTYYTLTSSQGLSISSCTYTYMHDIVIITNPARCHMHIRHQVQSWVNSEEVALEGSSTVLEGSNQGIMCVQ